MKQIEFSVSLDPNAPSCLDDAVTFETGASIQQVRDPATFAYNHHGPGFLDVYPGALTVFFEDLVLGRPLPVKFVAHRIDGMDTVVAMALFMHRELAIEPRTPGFVAQIDFLHRRGLTVVGHVDRDVEQMVVLLNEGPEKDDAEWLQRAIGWVREYLLTGTVPGTVRPTPVRIIDRGTNGFVVATSPSPSLLRAWIELYRQGFLRGVVLGDDQNGRRHVLVSRKSAYVELDLMKVAAILNEMEAAMGETPGWAGDGLWLASPPHGTFLLPEHLLQVLIRV
jgi:hypothetical protein